MNIRNNYYKKFGITSFGLHIFAMVFMLSDHLWGTFLVQSQWFGYMGRIAFPLFAFMLVEGYFHTSTVKKYAQRLLIFAVITEIPFNLMTASGYVYPFHQNVLFTFVLGIGMLSLFTKIKGKQKLLLKIIGYPLVVLLFFLLGTITFVDYYGYGLLMIALFYFTKPKDNSTITANIIGMMLQIIGMYWINCELMAGMMIPVTIFGMTFEVYKQGFALLALPFIWLYNGRQGPYNKTIRTIYYLFYPVHCLILGLIIKFI